MAIVRPSPSRCSPSSFVPSARRPLFRAPFCSIAACPIRSAVLNLSDLPVPVHAVAAARLFRYARTVFIAPPWPQIFRNDAERHQTLEEAERTYEAMVEVYTALGYTLVPLPLVSVEERVRFVTDYVANALGGDPALGRTRALADGGKEKNAASRR